MTKLRKILIFLLVLVLGGMLLVGCGGKSGAGLDGKTEFARIGKAIATVKPGVDVRVSANINLLTGVPNLTPEAYGKRPVAVMVNNIKPAFPQYGIDAADVIFEIPVEGGATRFMAMYGDYTQVPKICSIRSCRGYFPALSEGFDAVYVNWGMMDEVREYTNSLGLTQFDGKYNEGNLFSRDAERKAAGYSSEHTGVFDGTRLVEVMNEKEMRTDIEDGKKDTAFHFVAYGTTTTPTGGACTVANIDFGIAVATLTYDEATGTYLKAYNGDPQVDGVTGNQLSFTNVLVLEADIKGAANGIHRDVNWHGGEGYYISNGAIQKIKWSKTDEQSRLMLYDENGNELVMNRGKSYIAVNYVGDATFE